MIKTPACCGFWPNFGDFDQCEQRLIYVESILLNKSFKEELKTQAHMPQHIYKEKH